MKKNKIDYTETILEDKTLLTVSKSISSAINDLHLRLKKFENRDSIFQQKITKIINDIESEDSYLKKNYIQIATQNSKIEELEKHIDIMRNVSNDLITKNHSTKNNELKEMYNLSYRQSKKILKEAKKNGY